MYVLGVNLSHDRSACLLSDTGDIVAIAEERLDRQKHSCPLDRLNRLFAVVPQQSVRYCLQARDIGFDDLDAVVFCNAAIIGGNVIRNLSVADCATQMPWSPHSHLATINHHEAHALSAFVPSGFDEAVVLVVDKGGSVWDWWRNNEGVDVPLIERVSVYRASRDGLELLSKIHDRRGDMLWNCNSVGALYELATLQIGCTPFDAGKTMGLAPYGRTVYADAFKRQLELNAGGFQISPTVQSVGQHLFPQFYAAHYGPVNPQPDRPSQHYADLARAAQEAVEEIMVHLAREAHAMTGLPNLCIAGGLGLNCVANTRIEESTPFKQIFVQPAATDDGTAIGAAFRGLSLMGAPVSAPAPLARRDRPQLQRDRDRHGGATAIPRWRRTTRKYPAPNSVTWSASSPRAGWSVGSKAARSSARARSATAACSPTRGRRRCAPSSMARSNNASSIGPMAPAYWPNAPTSISNCAPNNPSCCSSAACTPSGNRKRRASSTSTAPAGCRPCSASAIRSTTI